MRGPWRCLVVAVAVFASLGVWTTPSSSAPPAPASGLVLLGTVVSMDAAASVVEGGVLVVGDRISRVWEGDIPDDVAPDVTVVTLPDDAAIFPGLINLHNHPLYAMESAWPVPADHRQPELGRPTGAEPYGNRYQWNTSQQYVDDIEGPRSAIASAEGAGLRPEIILYAEIQSLLSGTTSMQGGQLTPSVDSIGARNVDNPDPTSPDFSIDRVDTWVPTVSGDDFAGRVPELQTGFASGALDTLIVHVGEGVPDSERRVGDEISTRAELDELASVGLLTSGTVVIHGVALGPAEFAAMRGAPDPPGRTGGGGASLVWSPTSNLRLYARSADVTAALAAGVNVTLGTDWMPTGSPDLLVELKVADTVLDTTEAFGVTDLAAAGVDSGAARDLALVRMVTSNPAQALDWDDRVGSIEEGKVADLVVLGNQSAPDGDSPYRRLIAATEADVVLTMVGGDARAGDPDVMAQLKPDGFETVTSEDGTVEKAVAVVPVGSVVPGVDLSVATVQARLTDALATLPNPTELPALFTVDDEALRAILDAEQRFDYPAVFHHVVDGENVFAEDVFFDRWWSDDATVTTTMPDTTAPATTSRPQDTEAPVIEPPPTPAIDATEPPTPTTAASPSTSSSTTAEPAPERESADSDVSPGWLVAIGAVIVVAAVALAIVLARRRRR